MPELKHFSASEFGVWYPLMSPALMAKLDRFRDLRGDVVRISPAPGALGRELAGGNASQHNVIQWGEVRAADIMPLVTTPEGTLRGLTHEEMSREVARATSIGFTGIGVYMNWHPYPGMHLDVRADRSPGDPATWADIGAGGQHQYVALANVLPGVA